MNLMTRCSFNIAFQHGKQFTQSAFSLGGVMRVLDAMLDVGMNQCFGERFKAASRGDDLGQDFRAVLVLLQHALNRSKLSGDLAQTDDRSTSFLRRM